MPFDKELLKTHLEINPAQLDLEAALQADRFFDWAELSADTRAAAESADFGYDEVRSRIALKCRANPGEFGLEKATESAIEAVVDTHPAVRAAFDNLTDARRESARAANAANAMEQRKRMIEVLITLHGQQYFAGPSVPRDLVSAYKEHQERNGRAVNDKMGAAARKRVNMKGAT